MADKLAVMTDDEVIDYVKTLPDVFVMTASEENGSPKVAWGDSFVYYQPEDQEPTDETRFRPFATIVTKDYDDFDTESNLDRPGVFRVNVAVGRQRFADVLGYGPPEVRERRDTISFDLLDTFVPHPQYSAQGWLCVLNPDSLDDRLKGLLVEAHGRALRQEER